MSTVSPPPGSRQAPGRVTWSLSLDLDRLDARDVLVEVSALDTPRLRTRQVTVRVGASTPTDFDYRVPLLLRAAADHGVDLELDGTPRAVSAWWAEIFPKPLPRPPRHLQSVGP